MMVVCTLREFNDWITKQDLKTYFQNLSQINDT